jgi:hypothetical protein
MRPGQKPRISLTNLGLRAASHHPRVAERLLRAIVFDCLAPFDAQFNCEKISADYAGTAICEADLCSDAVMTHHPAEE